MRIRILCLMGLATLMAGTLAAQDIAATWQGTFNLDSDARRMVLDVAKNDKGGWDVPAFHVEFVHDDLHVDSLVLNGADLKFSQRSSVWQCREWRCTALRTGVASSSPRCRMSQSKKYACFC